MTCASAAGNNDKVNFSGQNNGRYNLILLYCKMKRDSDERKANASEYSLLLLARGEQKYFEMRGS